MVFPNLAGTCGRPGPVTLEFLERFASHSDPDPDPDPVLARAARAARDQASPPPLIGNSAIGE